MNMKKIKNIKKLDDIETQLKKDGYTFDNGECTFEGMPNSIASEKDKIEYLENSEIVYFDDKKVYSVRIDELGDYEVVDFKIRREIQEFIDSTTTTDNDEDDDEKNEKSNSFIFVHHHDESVYFKYHNGLWYDFNGFNSSKPYPSNPVGSTHKLYALYDDLVKNIMVRQDKIKNLDDAYFDFDIIRYGGVSARKIPNSCVIVKKE